MPPKKKHQLVKYCRIFQWVEAQDEEFAQAIRDLCMEGALSPGKRNTGVTFLYPNNSAQRNAITDMAYKDPDEAVILIEGLIIPDILMTAADFSGRPVGSRRGVQYGVEVADGKVKLAGIEIAPAEDFVPMAHRANDLAIWLLEKGTLPLASEKKYVPPIPPRKGKQGGSDGNELMGSRHIIGDTTANEFDACHRRDRCGAYNPYLSRVVSLMNFLREKSPDTYAVLLPVLDYSPFVTFYLIAEPYKTTGDYLVASSLVTEWGGAAIYTDAVAEYKAMLAEAGVTSKNFEAVIDRTRQQITAINNPRMAPEAVARAYAELSKNNSIAGNGPVLPEATQHALAGGKKLWQDEFRFIMSEALSNVCHVYTTLDFAKLVEDIRIKWPGNNYEKEILLSNITDLKTNVAPRCTIMMLVRFITSTDFLYLPVPPDRVGATRGSMNPTDPEIYNRNAVAYAYLCKTSMVHPNGISPQALMEVQNYVKMHGTLPSALTNLRVAGPAEPIP